MFVEEVLAIEDLDAEARGMSDLEVHTGFVGFFGSNKLMTEHTDNLLKGLDHKKGTQIMLQNWKFFKNFLLVMFGNFFVKWQI